MFGEQHAGPRRGDRAGAIEQRGAAATETFQPLAGLGNRRALLLAAPNLSAEPRGVVEHGDAAAAFGGNAGGGEPGWSGADDDDLEFEFHALMSRNTALPARNIPRLRRSRGRLRSIWNAGTFPPVFFWRQRRQRSGA